MNVSIHRMLESVVKILMSVCPSLSTYVMIPRGPTAQTPLGASNATAGKALLEMERIVQILMSVRMELLTVQRCVSTPMEVITVPAISMAMK
jgi:hypothetical protein